MIEINNSSNNSNNNNNNNNNNKGQCVHNLQQLMHGSGNEDEFGQVDEDWNLLMLTDADAYGRGHERAHEQ